MWSLTKKCWNKGPRERPGVPEVLEELGSKHGVSHSFVHCLLHEKRTGKDWYKSLPASLSAFFASRIRLIGERSDVNRSGRFQWRAAHLVSFVFELQSALMIAVLELILSLDPGAPHFPNAFRTNRNPGATGPVVDWRWLASRSEDLIFLGATSVYPLPHSRGRTRRHQLDPVHKHCQILFGACKERFSHEWGRSSSALMRCNWPSRDPSTSLALPVAKQNVTGAGDPSQSEPLACSTQ